MAFGEEARMFAELDAEERANSKALRQLDRIAEALERDGDKHADAIFTKQLLGYKRADRKVAITSVGATGYFGASEILGTVEEAGAGVVALRDNSGALSIFRISGIRSIREVHPKSEEAKDGVPYP